MGYSSFGFGPCLAEGVLCFELCKQRLTSPMSNSLFPFAGIKRCIFSVFLLGFRTFYPLHVLEPHKIPLETTQHPRQATLDCSDRSTLRDQVGGAHWDTKRAPNVNRWYRGISCLQSSLLLLRRGWMMLCWTPISR